MKGEDHSTPEGSAEQPVNPADPSSIEEDTELSAKATEPGQPAAPGEAPDRPDSAEAPGEPEDAAEAEFTDSQNSDVLEEMFGDIPEGDGWEFEMRRRWTRPRHEHCSHAANLARLILYHHESLLFAIRGDEPVDIYAVLPDGRFDALRPYELLVDTGARYALEIYKAGLGKREAAAMMAHCVKIHDAGMMQKLQDVARGLLGQLRNDGAFPPGMPVVRKEDIDSQLRYLGTLSGVVDLSTGEVLPPDKARRTFTASAVNVQYAPSTVHPLVDQILPPGDSLEPDSIEYYRARVVSYAMTNPVRREFLLELCASGSGKTTFANSLRVMKPYVDSISPDTLERPRYARGSTNHNTDVGKFGVPTRLMFCPEFQHKADKVLMKLLTGGDTDVPYRPIGEKPRAIRATATLWIQGNVPPAGSTDVNIGIGGDDDTARALRDRCKVLHRERIPEDQVDEGMVDYPTLDTPDAALFREAVLARVVSYTRAFAGLGWPDEITSVADAAAEAVRRETPLLAD